MNNDTTKLLLFNEKSMVLFKKLYFLGFCKIHSLKTIFILYPVSSIRSDILSLYFNYTNPHRTFCMQVHLLTGSHPSEMIHSYYQNSQHFIWQFLLSVFFLIIDIIRIRYAIRLLPFGYKVESVTLRRDPEGGSDRFTYPNPI